jgi:hypothetical protein
LPAGVVPAPAAVGCRRAQSSGTRAGIVARRKDETGGRWSRRSRWSRRALAALGAVAALPLAYGAVILASGILAPAGTIPGRRTDYRPYRHHPVRTVDESAPAAPSRVDEFGGDLDGPALHASGFFRVEQAGGRSWMVDPAGRTLLNIAVNSVFPGASPSTQAALGRRFGGAGEWAKAATELLRAAGFNGTGAWSDDRALARAPVRLARAPLVDLMAGYARQRGQAFQQAGHLGYPDDLIPVFEPGFEEYCEERARALAADANDPWLIGYFTDNELPFPADALDRALARPAGDPARAAAERLLEAKRAVTPGAAVDAALRAAFVESIAERYFGVTARAIRRHDPNHLLLGSRFYWNDLWTEPLIRAAGRWVDVVSFNVYGLWTVPPALSADWQRWSGRPFLVSEFYAKGEDSGLGNHTGAGWRVRTQADRGVFYQSFALALLEAPGCVGWHWFRYQDNDPAEPGADPSNLDSNKGLVSTGFDEYRPLIDRMRALNQRALQLARSKAPGGER